MPTDKIKKNKIIPRCDKCKHHSFWGGTYGNNTHECKVQGYKHTNSCYATKECYELYEENK